MRRKNKIVVSAVGIVVLVAILGTTTMSATTQYVTPTAVASGDFNGEYVNLEGAVRNLDASGDRIEFAVADENASIQVVFDGTMPETMANGRVVVATGHVEGDTVHASQLSVRAHEGSDN